jgi:hypothetical protein
MVAGGPLGKSEKEVCGVNQNHYEEHGENKQHSSTNGT